MRHCDRSIGWERHRPGGRPRMMISEARTDRAATSLRMIGSSYQAAMEGLPKIIVAITDRQRQDRSRRGCRAAQFPGAHPEPTARFKFEACLSAKPQRREHAIRPDHLADVVSSPKVHFAVVHESGSGTFRTWPRWPTVSAVGVQRKSSLDSFRSSRGGSLPWSQVRKYFERR